MIADCKSDFLTSSRRQTALTDQRQSMKNPGSKARSKKSMLRLCMRRCANQPIRIRTNCKVEPPREHPPSSTPHPSSPTLASRLRPSPIPPPRNPIMDRPGTVMGQCRDSPGTVPGQPRDSPMTALGQPHDKPRSTNKSQTCTNMFFPTSVAERGFNQSESTTTTPAPNSIHSWRMTGPGGIRVALRIEAMPSAHDRGL